MKQNKVLLMLFVFVLTLFSVNAVTTLTTCGEPNGGWINGETYIVDITEVNSSNSPTQWCFDLTNEWDKSLTFKTNIDDKVIVDSKTLFRFNYNATLLDIRDFVFEVDENSIVNDNPTFAYVNQKPYICTGGSCNTYSEINLDLTNVDFYSNVDSPFIKLYGKGRTSDWGIRCDQGSNYVAHFNNISIYDSKFVNRGEIFFLQTTLYVRSSAVCNYARHEGDIHFRPLIDNSLFLSGSRAFHEQRVTTGYGPGYTMTMGDAYSYVNMTNSVYGHLEAESKVSFVEDANSVIKSVDTGTLYKTMYGTTFVKNAYNLNSGGIDGGKFVMIDDENIGFTNSLSINGINNLVDTSFVRYVFDTILGIGIFQNSLDCSKYLSTFCFMQDTGNTQLLGFSNSGYLTISNNGIIKNLEFSQVQANDASIISHPTAGFYTGVSLINNILSRVYPSDNSAYYQTMVDLRADNLVIDGNDFDYSGSSQEYQFVSNQGSNTQIINNDFNVNSPSGNSNIPLIEVTGNSLVVKDNRFGLQGNSNSITSNFMSVFNVIGNNVEFTNNRFENTMTNVVTKSKVFENVGNGYFYHNWLDDNMIITLDNFTSLNINKQVGYEFNGRVYTFTIGNYYDGYSNTCADANSDGFCDIPKTLPNGQTDNYTLTQYPYNFQSHLLFAQNFFDFENFAVNIDNIIDGQTVGISSISSPLVIKYTHDATIDMTCDTYLDNYLIDVSENVGGSSQQTIEFNDWSYDKIYNLEVICHSGANIQRSSGTIDLIIDTTGTVVPPPSSGGGTVVPPPSSGGGGGGGGDPIPTPTPVPEQCQEPDFQFESCSNGNNITTFACVGTQWVATGETCNECAWWNPFCSNEPIIINESLPIFNPSPEIDLPFLKAEVKKICNVVVNPSEVTFTSDGQIQKLTITNNEDGSYSPDYKFVSSENYDSAIQSLSVTNEIGTLQSKGSVDFGVKYTVGTFTPQISYDKLILTHSECADVEVLIKTENNDVLLGGKFGGSEYGLPNVRLLSEIFGISPMFDLALLGISGLIFTYMNWNKRYTKKGRKYDRRNLVIKTLIITLWTMFSSLFVLMFMTLLFS